MSKGGIVPYYDAGGQMTGGGGGWWTRTAERLRRYVFGESVYSRSQADSTTPLVMANVSVGTITTALYQASSGNMQPLADIYDLMPASNPILKGLVRQQKAGIQAIPIQTVPVTEDAEAIEIAEDVKGQLGNPDAPLSLAINGIIESANRGGGLVETRWMRDTDDRWRWDGFELVPQQRIRFNANTGEIGFAETAFSWKGVPVSAFARGTFLCVTPDTDKPDFSSRGVYRSILTDWFAMQNAAAWWQGDLQFIGSPVVVATYKNDRDRAVLNNALQEMGPEGRLAVSEGTEFKLIERGNPGGSFGLPHHEFETTRTERMRTALLGSTKDSSVALDILADYWQTILAVLRRDLIQVYVALNHGLEKIALTPNLVVDLAPAVDAVTLLTAYEKATNLGLEVGQNFVRKALKWPQPEPGEEILEMNNVGQAPSMPSPQKINSPRRIS